MDAETALWVQAIAAGVQAVAAAVIVILTVLLIRTANGALRTADDQAEAAQQSNLELRIERQLSVLPMLSAEMIANWQNDGSLELEIAAHNWSMHPALWVRIRLLVGPWDRLPPTDPAAQPTVVRESPKVLEIVPTGIAKAFRWNIQPSDLPEIVVARMQYEGSLRSTVWQTYELQRHDHTFSFRSKERFILPSVSGAEPIVS